MLWKMLKMARCSNGLHIVGWQHACVDYVHADYGVPVREGDLVLISGAACGPAWDAQLYGDGGEELLGASCKSESQAAAGAVGRWGTGRDVMGLLLLGQQLAAMVLGVSVLRLQSVPHTGAHAELF